MWASPEGVDCFVELLVAAVLLCGMDDPGIRWPKHGGWFHCVRLVIVLGATDAVLCLRCHVDARCWIGVFLVVVSTTAARHGLTVGLREVGVNRLAAQGSVWLVAVAWLTLPLWFPFERLETRSIQRLIDIHPVFAMNTAVRPLGVWTEQPLPYRWIRLGQDFPYALPRGVWPMAGFHLLIGGLGLGSYWRRQLPGTAPDGPAT